MIISKIPKLILFVVLILKVNMMNAQNNVDSLSDQQQGLVAIAALTATGNLDVLETRLGDALDVGTSINEIKEALVQLYAYCGFPRSLNALGVFKMVLDERKARGIKDMVGKEILIENNSADRYEQGRKVLETLTKTPQVKPAPGFGEFAPRIDAFLKEHLFADIFISDVLSYQQRELVTISALASMSGVEAQLQSHIGMGINTGLSELQLAKVFELIGTLVNREQAKVAKAALLKTRIKK